METHQDNFGNNEKNMTVIMQTEHENRGENERKKQEWMPWALGILLVLFLVVLGLMIYFAANSSSSSSSGSSSSASTSSSSLPSLPPTSPPSSDCTSPACIALAHSILSSIDDTADPCQDFFQYACGNWQAEQDWELVKYSIYSQFHELIYAEMEIFLDALFYDTDPDLVNHSSILKATNFYSSCYDSTADLESVQESELLQEFLTKVTFTNGNTWDDVTKVELQNAISWLAVRGWNSLFDINIYDYNSSVGNSPWVYQSYETWLSYNSSAYRSTVMNTFVPFYESFFGMNESYANEMATNVADLADGICNISTVNSDYYDLSYMLSYETYYRSFSSVSQVFDDSGVLNLTKIIVDTYDYKDFNYLFYYKNFATFYDKLSALLGSKSPEIVEYFLVTNVFIEFLNFESSYEQSRSSSRFEFCFTQTLSYFPFVYGYILYHESYSTVDYNHIYNLVQNVTENGIRVGLSDATWIKDDTSLDESIKKIDNIGLYVGLPPRISNYTCLDIYYSSVNQSGSDFVGNLGSLLDFSAAVTQATMKDTLYDLITPWPSILENSAYYGFWLTGVNAFYVGSGNYFAIPITISQIPFFSVDYPASINFGGLGSVIGHEIGHGFDPRGSFYDYQGNYGDIWTNETRAAYEDNMQCFINQYDGLEVDGSYVDGTNTITENVADNGGVTASLYAFKTYVDTYGNDFTLPGVDLTSDQLFFFAWANLWCEVHRPGYYDDWTNVHAPRPARVWGVVQNSQAFADAYNCSVGDAMNPADKCILW